MKTPVPGGCLARHELHEAVKRASVTLGRKRLADGTLGYYVRAPRSDDCFAAAIATVLQVPIEDVPDPRLDERLAAGETPEHINRSAQDQLRRWLAGRGLRMVTHRMLPARHRRWIAVIPMRGHFNDHCIVMARDQLLFDPAAVYGAGMYFRGLWVREFRPQDATYGLSFIKTKRGESDV
jgi:hypothetical protein